MTIHNHIGYKQLHLPVRGNIDILHGVGRSFFACSNISLGHVILKFVTNLSQLSKTSCDRFFCIFTIMANLAGCQNDPAIPEDYVHTRMGEFYAESRGLTETSADSVVSYYHKFANFHGQYPECKADQLFQPTVENLDSAFTKYAIVQIGDIIVKTQWDGETHINF